MDHNINNNINETAQSAEKFELREILNRIDKIMDDNQYMNDTFQIVKSSRDLVELTAVLEQLSDMVTTRETTNQRVLGLLEAMYRDMSEGGKTGASSSNIDIDQFERIVKTLTENCDEDRAADIIESLVQQLSFSSSKNSRPTTFNFNSGFSSFPNNGSANSGSPNKGFPFSNSGFPFGKMD